MPHDPHQQPGTPQPEPGGDVVPILEQGFDAGSLYTLRAAVAAHTSHAGMPERRARDIVLAVHELASNAIRHGAGHGRLLITEHDGALHCHVTDDGAVQVTRTGSEAETRATSQEDAAWPRETGHGLWVVHQLADRLSVQSGPHATIVTASFLLPSPGQQSASAAPTLR
jgi:anti-sigma regulatory factor (Ser/Thr protein kinase)